MMTDLQHLAQLGLTIHTILDLASLAIRMPIQYYWGISSSSVMIL